MSHIGEFSEGNRFVHADQIKKRETSHTLSERITDGWHKVQHLGHAVLHPEIAPVPGPEIVAAEAVPPVPVVFEQAA